MTTFTYCWIFCAAQSKDLLRVDIRDFPADSPVDALLEAICNAKHRRGLNGGADRILQSNGLPASPIGLLSELLVNDYGSDANPVIFTQNETLMRLEQLLDRAEAVLGMSHSTRPTKAIRAKSSI